MDSAQVVARFEAERQALALMDHPHIARVFDAGTTDSGRPFFVMELVKGIPITQYCDEARLSPRQRLELFIPVCQAIQHAHQKGIIHRDVKPSNVLVTLVDGQPVPKVIDFGIAKATDQRLTEKSLFTELGSIVGTLEYMSPEQADLSSLDVDTRTDVYALGVLLYELLTGTTPLERERLREAGYAEILRRIKEEEPPRPSHAAVGLGGPAGVDRGGAQRRAGAVDPHDARRPGLDRDEGAGEESHPAVRDGQRVRPRRTAIPRRRRGGGVPAVGRLPAPQVRRQAPGGDRDGRGVRRPADRRGGDQHGDGRARTRAERAARGSADAARRRATAPPRPSEPPDWSATGPSRPRAKRRPRGRSRGAPPRSRGPC